MCIASPRYSKHHVLFSLGKKGVATTVINGMCDLIDRRDSITFARKTKKPSSGLFVAPPLLHTKLFATDIKSMNHTDMNQKIEAKSTETSARRQYHRLGHGNLSVIDRIIKPGSTACSLPRLLKFIVHPCKTNEKRMQQKFNRSRRGDRNLCKHLQTIANNCRWW